MCHQRFTFQAESPDFSVDRRGLQGLRQKYRQAAMATGTQKQGGKKSQMGSLLPHLKGLQSPPVAYQQAYFTDMFIRERCHYPESTPGACNAFNLDFGPVLGSEETPFLLKPQCRFQQICLQKCHSISKNTCPTFRIYSSS